MKKKRLRTGQREEKCLFGLYKLQGKRMKCFKNALAYRLNEWFALAWPVRRREKEREFV